MIEAENIEIKAEVSVDDTGTVTGIAWPFDAPDSVGDVIEKGTIGFANSVPMVMEHDQQKVVGVWETYAETDKGLEVKGRLFVEGIGPARDAHRQLKAGKIGGLSIGFRHTGFEPRTAGGRVFKSITVNEISLCSRPVHPGARITVIKSQIEENMENENENTPVAKSDPVVTPEELKAIKTRMDKLEAKSNRPIAANGNHPAAANDNDERKAFVSFLRRGIERISPDEVKALTVSTDANGGYLAPEEFGNELIKLLNEYSPIRSYARVVGISSPEIKYPRRVSGTAATWVAETDPRTASDMTFEQITLTPFEIATHTDISNQLLEDNAYGLEGELLADYAESFGKTEGLAFVKGTGVGQPKGIMAASGIKEIKTGVAAAFPTSNPADVIIGMYHQIPTTHAQSGVWLMNRNTLAVIRQWKDGTGRYLVLDPITAGGTLSLLGRPIVEMPDMDDIGAGKYPILFGDMSGYRIIDRVGLSTLRDPYSLAAVGQVRFHARKRVGADVTHPDRFVKLKVAA
ncbi:MULTISPECIES: phage major capsid protein [unclassified Rhizobium]|uniref:phage major capsid protein n=1 Tax=unclassified Rhizobium TaxID=2613769 RepID=UPI001AD98DFC|nr:MULTISPECIES: phage major capsid protein [unclassified Rhizobium]MBO9097649.1 phage major capsid protein [Rhizobium sp. L58/93]MBO9183844.1 phage major capsid protein [Rhizobium sp. E27B/91]QXZ84092.1 phage major capsid protein [Rhizobium sp. K1/93]QXZ88395.1 phage major capsid protein [Rhizobium sp. K15/93]QYA00980.1 phage major capsid protein [Rhizobium sp. B21/90]